jgi:hypothetical protein
MKQLEKIYGSLSKFSDLNWDEVTREYAKVESKISFPEYLQIKSEEGDCPEYLFELAFYEMARAEINNSQFTPPTSTGVFLNPTALFLSLQFDIEKMLKDAEIGKIEIHERAHVLCLYRDKKNALKSVELQEEALNILEHLEDGPQKDLKFLGDKDHKEFLNLVNLQIVFNITN